MALKKLHLLEIENDEISWAGSEKEKDARMFSSLCRKSFNQLEKVLYTKNKITYPPIILLCSLIIQQSCTLLFQC